MVEGDGEDDGEDDEDEGRRRSKREDEWRTRVCPPRLSLSVNVFGLLPLIFPDFSGIVPGRGRVV